MVYFKIWLNLTFAALNLVFIRARSENYPVFHADLVIIRLPCGQVQLSRIWKVQCDWLSLGKRCCLGLSRRFWFVGRDERRVPLKTPVWEARRLTETTKNELKRWFTPRNTFQTIEMIDCILAGFMKKMQCNTLNIKTVAKQVWFYFTSGTTRPGYAGSSTKRQIVLNTQENPYLN